MQSLKMVFPHVLSLRRAWLARFLVYTGLPRRAARLIREIARGLPKSLELLTPGTDPRHSAPSLFSVPPFDLARSVLEGLSRPRFLVHGSFFQANRPIAERTSSSFRPSHPTPRDLSVAFAADRLFAHSMVFPAGPPLINLEFL